MEWLAENTQARFGIPVKFKANKRLKCPKREVQILLFRSVRELLINAAKHSEAKQVQLLVKKEGKIYVTQVSDNGKGADLDKLTNSEGFGLPSIRERLRHLGGEMLIDSKPGKGTTVTLKVPDID